MHNDSSYKYKEASKCDDYFNMDEDDKIPSSPPLKLEGIAEVFDDNKSDESDDVKEMLSPLNKLSVRVKSECFQNKDFDLEFKEESENGIDEEKVNKSVLIWGAYHMGKESEE